MDPIGPPDTKRLTLPANNDTKKNSSFKPRRRPKSVIVQLEDGERKQPLCNRLEKCLILIISLMLIFCVVLLCLYLTERKRNTVLSEGNVSNKSSINQALPSKLWSKSCWTKECIQSTADLLSSLNPKINPCDDFYGYACGGWTDKNPSPAAIWDQFSKLTEENNKLMKSLIESKGIRAMYSRDEAITKGLNYYDSCMDKAEIERLGGEPMKELLKKYGGWAVIDKTWDEKRWDFMTYFVKAHKELDSSPFFSVFVDLDLKNSSVNIINIDQSFVGLSSNAFTKNASMYQTMRQAYKEVMVNVTTMLGGDDSSLKEMDQLFEFERKVAKILIPMFMRSDTKGVYSKMTVKQLQNNTCPEINWLQFFQGVFNNTVRNITEDEEVVVLGCMEYLVKLCKLLSKTPKRLISNFILWRVVKSQYVQLSNDYTSIYKNYFFRAFNYFPDYTRQKQCMERLYNNFGMPISRLYLDRRFNAKSKAMATEIVENIRLVFIENVKANKWMDNATKQAAQDKATALLENVGYPDSLMDKGHLASHFKSVHVDRKTYFMNEVSIRMGASLKNLEKLGKPVDKNEWPFPPTMLNAYYSYSENKMVFPAGVLQSPFYDLKYSRAINYGAIGSIMGHELTHGFDDTGKNYDKKGNFVKWWTDSTLISFHNKSQCLVEQYGNYTFHGSPVDGDLTLSENIADNGGIKQAFKAYKKWVNEHGDEPKLPGMMLTNEQVFFLAFARNWCGRYSKLSAKMILRYDAHAPMAWRVNGSLKNFDDFSKTFKCPLGSPMNPVKKCGVW